MPFVRISQAATHRFIKYVSGDKELFFEFHSRQHSLYAYKEGQKVFELRLPLTFPALTEAESIHIYTDKITLPPGPYLMILVQAEYCALGYFNADECLRHKAIQTYVTRKTHGKSQLTFVKSGRKGGSAGSQLRYRNAISFFEKINETLNEWNTVNRSERILYSCPINLWNFLFNSKVKSPFSKEDPRLHKIPLDVRIPNYAELLRVNKSISHGYLSCDNPGMVEQFLSEEST